MIVLHWIALTWIDYINVAEEESNIKKVKPVAISDVKNKLKKKSDVINKRGPMKAVHPVDSMQKKLSMLDLLNIDLQSSGLAYS